MNCQAITKGSFCSACGQKTSTQRFSLNHFLTNDLIVNIIQVNKGFFYTLKELFTRPGHSIREYIEGKRAKHFNYIGFLLILITAWVYLDKFSAVKFSQMVGVDQGGMAKDIEFILAEYQKTIQLIIIFPMSLISYWTFKKSGLYFTEHIVMNTYKTGGEFVLSVLITIANIFYGKELLELGVLRYLNLGVGLYSMWFLYQYFSKDGYNKWRLIWKCFMLAYVYSLLIVISMTLVFIVIKRALF